MQNVPYDGLRKYLEWVKTKFELKYNPPFKNFPILYNCIYWAHLGSNVGSEEDKHRPVIVTRTYKNSPLCAIIPITSQRLNDKRQYHVDLECTGTTALVEQMRVIDIARIDKPMRRNGKIVSVTENDWRGIDFQIKREYSLYPLKGPTNKRVRVKFL